QQNTSAKPTKQGPGCVASLAKGVTALIVWAVILACVAGGGYLIYWQMNRDPAPTETADTTTPDDPASANTRGNSNTPGNTRESSIFEGLGVSDNSTPTDPTPDPINDTPDVTPPTTDPDPTPPTPAINRDLAKQIVGLEKLLVSLSQYTRNDFTADLRAKSSEGMQNKLNSYPQALAALDAVDPTLSPRIRAAIDAFAADTFDGSALREEIKTIRQAIDKLQPKP
ncbi:MAG: hypothetical protein AB8C95_06800, partial [Phycisphaeraceae bacterium]